MASCEVCGGPVNNKHSVCRQNRDCRQEYRRRAQDVILERLGDYGPDNWDAVLEQASEYQRRKLEEDLTRAQRERARRRRRYRDDWDRIRERERTWRQNNPERVRAWERSYRRAHREKLRAAGQEWYQANRARLLEYGSGYRSALRSTVEGTARLMFLGSRARARARGLPFDLTAEWVESELAFALENGCPLLGIEITLDRSDGRRPPGTPSIDRFRPELGYTQANCWVISFRANSMKQDASLDFMRRVLGYADTRFAVGPAVETA